MGLFNDALDYAIQKHMGQTRKRAKLPYILHPMEVATVAASMTNDEEVLAAALLHDTVEDSDATLEEIEERFGRRVSLLVMTETEDKRYDRPPQETWKLRKAETLSILKNTKDIGVKFLWMSDKLANMRSFYRQYRKEGVAMWEHYNQKDPAEQAWYYRSIAEYLSELKEYEAYQEYISLVNVVFESVISADERSAVL